MENLILFLALEGQKTLKSGSGDFLSSRKLTGGKAVFERKKFHFFSFKNSFSTCQL